jgi:hypothetical protein
MGRYRDKGTTQLPWVDDLEAFFTCYEDEVLENQRLLAFDIALKETPTRWWGSHKEIIKD